MTKEGGKRKEERRGGGGEKEGPLKGVEVPEEIRHLLSMWEALSLILSSKIIPVIKKTHGLFFSLVCHSSFES